MNLFIRSRCRFLVDRYGLNNMGAGNVICSCGANGIVRSIQGNGVKGAAGPGEILIRADDGEDLFVGVRNSEEDCVCASLVAVHTAIRQSASLVEDCEGRTRGAQRRCLDDCKAK